MPYDATPGHTQTLNVSVKPLEPQSDGDDGVLFFRGLIFAVPLSLAFWGVAIWAAMR